MNNELLQSSKDEAAREIEGFYGKFKDWQDVSDHGDMNEIEAVVDRAMEIYGQAQWNAAIEKAAKSAEVEKTGNSGSYLDASINKQSILKLKR